MMVNKKSRMCGLTLFGTVAFNGTLLLVFAIFWHAHAHTGAEPCTETRNITVQKGDSISLTFPKPPRELPAEWRLLVDGETDYRQVGVCVPFVPLSHPCAIRDKTVDYTFRVFENQTTELTIPRVIQPAHVECGLYFERFKTFVIFEECSIGVVGEISSPANGDGSETNVAAIVGGAIVVVAVVTITIIGIVVWKRRRNLLNANPPPRREDKDEDHTYMGIDSYPKTTPPGDLVYDDPSPRRKDEDHTYMAMDSYPKTTSPAQVTTQHGKTTSRQKNSGNNPTRKV